MYVVAAIPTALGLLSPSTLVMYESKIFGLSLLICECLRNEFSQAINDKFVLRLLFEKSTQLLRFSIDDFISIKTTLTHITLSKAKKNKLNFESNLIYPSLFLCCVLLAIFVHSKVSNCTFHTNLCNFSLFRNLLCIDISLLTVKFICKAYMDQKVN